MSKKAAAAKPAAKKAPAAASPPPAAASPEPEPTPTGEVVELGAALALAADWETKCKQREEMLRKLKIVYDKVAKQKEELEAQHTADVAALAEKDARIAELQQEAAPKGKAAAKANAKAAPNSPPPSGPTKAEMDALTVRLQAAEARAQTAEAALAKAKKGPASPRASTGDVVGVYGSTAAGSGAGAKAKPAAKGSPAAKAGPAGKGSPAAAGVDDGARWKARFEQAQAEAEELKRQVAAAEEAQRVAEQRAAQAAKKAPAAAAGGGNDAQMRRLQQQLDAINQENGQLKDQIAEKNRVIAQSRSQAAGGKKGANQAAGNPLAPSPTRERAAAGGENGEELEQARAELAEARNALAALKAARRAAGSDDDYRGRYDEARAELQRVHALLKAAQKGDIEEEFKAQQEAAAKEKEQANTLATKLHARIHQQSATIEELRGQVTALQTQIEENTNEARDARDQSMQAVDKFNVANKVKKDLLATNSRLRREVELLTEKSGLQEQKLVVYEETVNLLSAQQNGGSDNEEEPMWPDLDALIDMNPEAIGGMSPEERDEALNRIAEVGSSISAAKNASVKKVTKLRQKVKVLKKEIQKRNQEISRMIQLQQRRASAPGFDQSSGTLSLQDATQALAMEDQAFLEEDEAQPAQPRVPVRNGRKLPARAQSFKASPKLPEINDSFSSDKSFYSPQQRSLRGYTDTGSARK